MAILPPSSVRISLDRLQENLTKVRRLAGSHRTLVAVVKADAYAHGAVPIARALQNEGVAWFAVATVEEAIELRQNGIKGTILLLNELYADEFYEITLHNLVPSVSSLGALKAVADCARRHQKEIELHLKVDTGMGRLGVRCDRIASWLSHYMTLQGVKLTGLFTHLSSAETSDSHQTKYQLRSFSKTLHSFQAAGVCPRFVHVSNSSALISNLASEENMVRIGALLYGFCVAPNWTHSAKADVVKYFEPILEWKSRIVLLKDMPQGAPLGYGEMFYTRRPSRIATVPLGYANGLNRKLSNRGYAIVRGQRAPIVGAISMDLTLLDVSTIPGVEVGDEVTFLGKSGKSAITVHDMAQWADTIPYEILCSISKRVPRHYT